MRHVGGEPADDEARAENAAVIEDVAVLIGGALPRHDALSDGGLRLATHHWVRAKNEMPMVATRPLLQGWWPAHSMAS
jgi:hypothetical protein